MTFQRTVKGHQVDISESFLAPATEAAIDEIKWTYSKRCFFFFLLQIVKYNSSYLESLNVGTQNLNLFSLRFIL